MNTLTCFTLTVTDHVAHLVLNRPEAMNTMHPQFWRELDALLADLHRGSDARALVISSTGKHFSAGMALETFGGAITLDDRSPEGRAAVFDQLTDMQATFTRIEELRIPVIAAIHGGCIGGALDMVAAACIRYATRDAFFCIQEINIGMVADVGSLQRLPKLMPLGLLNELAYTGRRLPAERALECGLVTQLFDSHETLVAGALACANEIATKPPVAVWGTKQAVRYARDHGVHDSLRQMGWLQGAIWSNRHVGEAVSAMQAKRAGDFPALAPLKRFSELG
ncbi:enoyl-CoA hydratase-related protein [Diaphorobacter sp. MNS-0]|uniref:enoyl-CoA hydratase-related protein n=1 Tax=Diaphorobacter sp. MNS-0 TaxID=2866628 RepID=UPI001C72C479|nr:enoyl-CoA hydratase-related protein [Diaphorobacter sp. MNS-0]QYY24132.1 enoyl-CoA hydratase/isomerase family protein [Diaphorobacter sp. MNS-0]